MPLTLPGEQARVRITQSKPGYATAEAEEILRAAPERIAPACPHFGVCGGCHYQHTDYATQLAFKQAILRETLERGGVAVPAEIAVLCRRTNGVIATASGWPSMRRGTWAIAAAARMLWFLCSECPIAAPLLVEAALAFAEVARGFAPALQPTEIALFCDAAETALLATVFTASPAKMRFDELAQALHERIPALTGAELVIEGRSGQPPRTLAQWGAASLAYRSRRLRLIAWIMAHFFRSTAGWWMRWSSGLSLATKAQLAWDLFAGVGLFARQLAANFARVVAVESAPSATAALEANLRGTTGEAVKAEALAFLRRSLQRRPAHPDLIVVDPPRTGLGAETCALLAEIAAPALVYVSCDPATLARDLRALIASGYQIQSVTLADLFPQTFHLETVVHLRRA